VSEFKARIITNNLCITIKKKKKLESKFGFLWKLPNEKESLELAFSIFKWKIMKVSFV
jgi:hypothetical protein